MLLSMRGGGVAALPIQVLLADVQSDSILRGYKIGIDNIKVAVQDRLDLSDFDFATVDDALALATDTGVDIHFDFSANDSITLFNVDSIADLSDNILI